MKNFRWLAGAAAVLALAGINASANVITNFPVKDSGTYLGQCDGRSSRGGAPRIELTVGTNTPGATGDGALIKFDLRPGNTSVIPPGHVLTGARLKIRRFQTNSARWKLQVVAYPLKVDWAEGTCGLAANPGTIPWQPTAVGDVTALYRSVTEVDMATNIYFNSTPAYIPTTDASWGSWKLTTALVARAGIAWDVPCGRGIDTDVVNRKMIDVRWESSNYASGWALTNVVGMYLADFEILPEGLNVIKEWANGTLDNHGINIWPICLPNDQLIHLPTFAHTSPRIGSKEIMLGANPQLAYPPELVLFTVQPPNPRTLLIFR